MSVIKDNGMKVVIIVMKMVCFAATFQVTMVSQDVEEAASQTCGVHSMAASALKTLVNIAGIPTGVTKLQEKMYRAIQMMWRTWLSML